MAGLRHDEVPEPGVCLTHEYKAAIREALNGEWEDDFGARWTVSGQGDGIRMTTTSLGGHPVHATGTVRFVERENGYLNGYLYVLVDVLIKLDDPEVLRTPGFGLGWHDFHTSFPVREVLGADFTERQADIPPDSWEVLLPQHIRERAVSEEYVRNQRAGWHPSAIMGVVSEDNEPGARRSFGTGAMTRGLSGCLDIGTIISNLSLSKLEGRASKVKLDWSTVMSEHARDRTNANVARFGGIPVKDDLIYISGGIGGSGPLTMTRLQETVSLRFVVRTEGVYQEIEGELSFFGGPIAVEVRYDTDQERDTVDVTLEWEMAEGPQSRVLAATRTAEDPRHYRSEEFFVFPPPSTPGPSLPEVRP